MAEKAQGVNTVKLLDCVLGPGTKSCLSAVFDLTKIHRASIHTRVTFPPRETGEVVVHVRTSPDGKVFDDQDFSIYTVCGPVLYSEPADEVLDQLKAPVTIDHVHCLCSPMQGYLAADYLAVIVKNASCPKAVIAVVEGLWMPFTTVEELEKPK